MKRLTLERFDALARSYGSDLNRWPEEARAAAEALASASLQAQAILLRERRLDEALSGAAEAGRWTPAEQGAALARTQQRVAERIAPPRPAPRRGFGGAIAFGGGVQALDTAAVRLALGAGLAITTGLLIGVLSAPASPDHVLTLLQPAPILFLSD